VNVLKHGSILVALWAIANGQPSSGAEPQDVLVRVAAKLAVTEKRIPNLTCVETVTRNYYRPESTLPRACSILLEQRKHRTKDLILRHLSTDRLRLDVTMVRTGELFSWVGASNFDDRGIDHLVHDGPMGTGAYRAFLTLVFLEDAKALIFDRAVISGGRSLLEYSFRVKRADSHYRVKLGGSWVHTAYSGTFQLDPSTDEVVRMNVQEDELPDASEYCTTVSSLNFQKAEIGNIKFLLAARAAQRYVYGDGEEVENTTTFSNCREYLGESKITFSDDAEPERAASKEAAPAMPGIVPAGLRFTIELTKPIETESAAAGDPFTGKLVEPLRDGKHKVLAPAGSVVDGRLHRVQSFQLPRKEAIIIMKPETIEINGSKVPLSAIRDWSGTTQRKIRLPPPGRSIPESSYSPENTSR
jgi:hypothetical protein